MNPKADSAQKLQAEPAEPEILSGADIIVRTLVSLGVDTIFGYSGGAILPAYDAIFRYNAENRGADDSEPINLVVPANEQGAGFMAAGYARAGGRPGVFLVTSGPGATNCVTPIRDCMADSIPVVLISGQVPTAAMGTDAFQEAPIFNVMSPCAKHVFLVQDGSRLEDTLRSAFEIATGGRPGPVVVDIPKDVQNWEGVYKGEGSLSLHGYTRRVRQALDNRVDRAKADEFFALLRRSRRPLLYIGGGAILGNAGEALRRFVDRYQIPHVSTLMGIGALDTTQELSLGMLGMHGTAHANYAVEDCDLLIAVGARFDDRVATRPAEFAPHARAIVHIDIDVAELGKVIKADWSHHGDAAMTLEALMEFGANVRCDFEDWRAHIAELKSEYALNYDRDSDLIQPYYLLEELNKLIQGEAIVATGVGQHQMWAAQYVDYKNPRTWLTSGSMGTMGFGLPAAIGAQLACPDRMVFDIDGDGSLRMNFGELETVTTYDLPVKILLLNNHGDGMVRQWQKTFFKNRFAGSDKSLHRKDFVKAAEADGFEWAERVDQKADVPDVLKRFVAHKGPAFLEVVIDQEAGVYPMVSPGTGYSQMLTGDYIKRRAPSSKVHGTDDESPDPIKSPNMF